MDRMLVCELVEAAFRAGAAHGAREFNERATQASVDAWALALPVDCYTVVAKSPELTRVMARMRT